MILAENVTKKRLNSASNVRYRAANAKQPHFFEQQILPVLGKIRLTCFLRALVREGF